MSARYKLEFELQGSPSGGTTCVAHTVTWAINSDHWGSLGRLWGVSGARLNLRGEKKMFDDRPLPRELKFESRPDLVGCASSWALHDGNESGKAVPTT